jgi:hypothetical protein
VGFFLFQTNGAKMEMAPNVGAQIGFFLIIERFSLQIENNVLKLKKDEYCRLKRA